MKRLAAILGIAIAVAGSTLAGVVAVPNPPTPPVYLITAQARWGATGQEGILATPGLSQNLNPSGTPAWQTSLEYTMRLDYSWATGTTVFAIDFNRDGIYQNVPGVPEVLTATTPSLVGKSFNRFNIFGSTGSNATNSRVFVSSLVINGDSFGPYSSPEVANGSFNQLFENTGGLFGDITAIATFRFNGGTAQERPRLWFQLGDAADYAVIPAPGAALLGVLGLSIAGWVKRRLA